MVRMVEAENCYLKLSLPLSSKKSDVISRLSELQKKLAEISQDERPKGLHEIASELVSKRYLEHSDKDVKLLVMCCLVDVLRVYAPDAPFSDKDMCKVYEGLVAQLKGLSTNAPDSAIGIRIFYILHSLSTVKSCVVPVILNQAQVPGANEIVYSLFESLITSVHSDLSESILEHICSILESCLEEMSEIEPEIFELLLKPIIPSNKAENQIAYTIVENVIQRVASHIEPSISKFLNQIIVGSNIESTATDLTEHIYPLIYELHKISPDLLHQVIPNICMQLETEEEDVRLKAVKLVGRLFASTHANYAGDFNRLFTDFLLRFSDTAIDIRLQMIDIGCMIMTRHSHLLAVVEVHMRSRLYDPDARVRSQALNKLLEIGLQDVTLLKVDTIDAMAGRVRDRKIDTAIAALTGIAKIYFKNVSSCLPGIDTILSDNQKQQNRHNSTQIHNNNKKGKKAVFGSSAHDASVGVTAAAAAAAGIHHSMCSLVPPEIFSRCRIIPGYIINCWGNPDTAMKNLVIQLLQECILPRSLHQTTTSDSSAQSQTNKHDSSAQSQNANSNANAAAAATDALNSCRVTALLLLFESLDEPDRGSLGSILGYKTKLRQELSQFVQAVQDYNASLKKGSGSVSCRATLAHSLSKRSTSSHASAVSGGGGGVSDRASTLSSGADASLLSADEIDDDFDATTPIKKSIYRLHQMLPYIEKKNPELEKLVQMKDKHIMRLLSVCCSQSNSESIVESCKHRDDLKKKLESKSVVGQYVGALYDLAGYLFINSDMTQYLLEYLIRLKEQEQCQPAATHASTHGSYRYLNDLLLLVSKHVSGSFKNSCSQLATLVALSSTTASSTASLSANINEEDDSDDDSRDNLIPLSCLASVFNLGSKSIAEDSDDPSAVQCLCRGIMTALLNTSDIRICETLAEALLRIELHVEQAHGISSKQLQSKRSSTFASSSYSSSSSSADATSAASVELITLLTSEERLCLDNPRLYQELQILASLMKLPSAITVTDLKHPFCSLIMPISAMKYDDIVRFITQELLSADTIRRHLATAAISSTSTSSGGGKHTNKRSKFKDNHQQLSSSSSSSSSSSASSFYTIFDAICSGFTLWTSLVGTNEEIAQWARNNYKTGQDLLTFQASSAAAAAALRDEDDAAGVCKGLEELIEVLFTTMLSNGKTITAEAVLLPTNTDDDADDSTAITAAIEPICQRICNSATLAFISLLRLQSMADYLSVEHWKCIAWKFLDQDSAFRKRLVDQFGVLIQTCAVHPKFLAFQSLLATDEKYYKQAQVAMVFAMKRLRSSHEILSSRVLLLSESSSSSSSSSTSENNDNYDHDEHDCAIKVMKKRALENMPETILPYVLYLLSYHPEFPTSSTLDNESDEKKVKNIIRSVTMVIDSLLASLKRDSDNLSYLLKQVNTIVQDYVDCNDPANIGLHFVSRLTIQKLKEHIKTSENVSVYPGEIVLPMTLFQRAKRGKNRQAQDDEYSDILHMNGNTQDTFEKVFNQKVKKMNQKQPSKQTNLGSPTARKTKREGVSNKSRSKSSSSHVSNKTRKRVSDDDTVESTDEDSTAPAVKPLTRVSTSNRPVRATRNEVNYKEKDESMKEAEKWEKAAAVANKSENQIIEKKRLSHLSYVNIEAVKKARTSFNVWKDENERVSHTSVMSNQSQASNNTTSNVTILSPSENPISTLQITKSKVLVASKKANQNTVNNASASVEVIKNNSKPTIKKSKVANGSENHRTVSARS